MTTSVLSPSEAAERLGVSTKALRIYEERGLVTPGRTAAGWRTYGPEEMARATEVVALRALGLSLAQIAHVLEGDPEGLEQALTTHQATLEAKICELEATIARLRDVRADLARGSLPTARTLADLVRPTRLGVRFTLPWPWGGEPFELADIRPLSYIVGPLGSGKTQLAMRLAEALPGTYLGLDRLARDGAAARARLAEDPDLAARVEQALAWLVDDGATASGALIALLVGIESDHPVIVDMIEQELDQATQEAVISHLRRLATPDARPLFLMTRSSAILDLAAVGHDETIILCPANHAPPTCVVPHPGARGYEAVETCLSSPEVRARTRGVIAVRSAEA